MTGLLLVGLGPFVVMSIIVGHLVKIDAASAVVGGLVVLFALFGGAFGMFFNSGATLTVVKLLPSFWLVQAAKAALAGGWPAQGWIVTAVWVVPLAAFAYRRDTSRA